jgi:hypothetical protein
VKAEAWVAELPTEYQQIENHELKKLKRGKQRHKAEPPQHTN